MQYLETSGLIVREGDMIKQARSANATEGAPTESVNAATEAPTKAKDTSRVPSVSTAFAHAPEGVLRFNVDVNVDLREFASWSPDRISAFWAGIAQVLAAKAEVEKSQGG